MREDDPIEVRLADVSELLSEGKAGAIDDWVPSVLEGLGKDEAATVDGGLSMLVLALDKPKDDSLDD